MVIAGKPERRLQSLYTLGEERLRKDRWLEEDVGSAQKLDNLGCDRR